MKLFPIAGYRKWLLGGVLLTLVAWGGVYFVLYKNSLGIDLSCDSSKYETGNLVHECLDKIDILYAFYFGYFIKSILLVSVILLFLPERAFKWWRWFAMPSIPLLVRWIIIEDSDFFGHEGANFYSGFFFLVFSLLIAIVATIVNYLKKRRENKKAN